VRDAVDLEGVDTLGVDALPIVDVLAAGEAAAESLAEAPNRQLVVKACLVGAEILDIDLQVQWPVLVQGDRLDEAAGDDPDRLIVVTGQGSTRTQPMALPGEN